MSRSFRTWDLLADAYDALAAHPDPRRRAFDALTAALRLAIPSGADPLRIIDLGAGTGRASLSVRAAAGDRTLRSTLVDGSPRMLQRASQALSGSVARVRCGALEDADTWAELDDARFDVAVSSFAVQYLSPPAKLRLFARVARLVPGGVFALVDRVATSGFAQELAARAERDSGGDPLARALDGEHPALHGLPQDERRPAAYLSSVDAHLQWLSEAGFDAACVFREHDMAVVLARPAASDIAAVDTRPPEERHVGRARVYASVVEAIGNTPLVALDRLCSSVDGRILLKLEYYNPGASKKDRIAYEMVRAARMEGKLAPGQMVIELTSGNTGTGLAIACTVLGHPFVAVMSTGNSVERVRMMTAFGAKVELVPQAPGSTPGKVSGVDLALVDQRAQELVEKHGAFRTDQFELPANPFAHEHGTGMEILRQTGGNLTAFVDFVGSAGTLIGTARTLKAWSPEIKCYAVEPAGAAFLAGEPVTRPNHKIQGGGYARRLTFFDRALCDGFLQVADEDAIAVARELAQREGIFGGFSTGANVAAALQLLHGPHRGGTIVCVAPDSGLKYLSTDLYSREL